MFKYNYDLENVKLYCCFKNNCVFVSILFLQEQRSKITSMMVGCGEIEHCALPVGGLLNYQRLVTLAEQFDYYWSRVPSATTAVQLVEDCNQIICTQVFV